MLPDGSPRYFNGIVRRFSQGHRVASSDGLATLTQYRAVMVPLVWTLTKKAQSRIFQQMTVPDILKQVLTGIDVSYQLQGTYEQRDYCIQYSETDFNFASRLMEEEGIYYYFTALERQPSDDRGRHAAEPRRCARCDHCHLRGARRRHTPGRPGSQLGEDARKSRSGKYRLWDSCFELPGKNLEAVQPIVQDGRRWEP